MTMYALLCMTLIGFGEIVGSLIQGLIIDKKGGKVGAVALVL